MIKNKVVLEVQVGERVYSMECYHDSPLGEIHDALSHMKGFIIQKMKDAEHPKESPSIEG